MATGAAAVKEFLSGPKVIETARLLLERYPLLTLIQALGAARPEDADEIVEALESLATMDEVRTSIVHDANLLALLCQGASSPDRRLRKMTASLALRLAKGDDVAEAAILSSGVLVACEALLVDPDTGTAEAASATFSLVAGKDSKGREAVIDSIGRLKERVKSLGDVEKIRLLSLYVEMGRNCEACFAALEQQGAYQDVTAAFFTDDLLLKLISVELMNSLGSFPRGQEYLSRQGVPARLAAELADPTNDSSVVICVVHLLGLVVSRVPQTLAEVLPNKDAAFAQAIAAFLSSRDIAERLCALTAWSQIMEPAEGLAFGIRLAGIMDKVIELLSTTQLEACKGAMACWTSVLAKWPPLVDAKSADGSDDSVALWSLAEQRVLPAALKNLVGKPFPDARVLTWRLLAVLAQSRLAAQRALSSEEMRQVLLDFGSEQNSDARIAKHSFVLALCRHTGDFIGAIYDDASEKVLQDFARRGPHWAPRPVAQSLVSDGAA